MHSTSQACHPDSPTVYFVECDLHYPSKLHALHDAYLFATKHVHIDEEMLSDKLRLMLDVVGLTHHPCTKLISNLSDKTCYVMHYCYLQFYLSRTPIGQLRFTTSSRTHSCLSSI